MDENSNILENSDMINFSKFRMIYNTIHTLLESAELFSYRSEEEDVIVASLFKSSPIISNADDLYNESLQCEARKGLGATGAKFAALSPRDTSSTRRKKSF
jgi:hypothetical protein